MHESVGMDLPKSKRNCVVKAFGRPATFGKMRRTSTIQTTTHPVESAHIILEGEMTLKVHGQSTTYRAGDRCDVPAGTVHAVQMGSAGCRYLIGEK